MLNSEEMGNRALEITRSVDTPIVVDGGAGFGHPPHVYKLVNSWAKIGVDGLFIEDAVYPKRLHYHAGEVNIVESDDMVKKIEAAVKAREEMNEDIFLIARTDAGRRQRREEEGESIDDAIERANKYLSAGAEAAIVFPHSRDELVTAVEEINGPVSFPAIKSYDPHVTVSELREIGVASASYAITTTVATHNAVKKEFENLLENGKTSIPREEFVESRKEVEETIDLPKYYDIEEEAGLRESDELYHEGRKE
jgi:methylisocitrate lyase